MGIRLFAGFFFVRILWFKCFLYIYVNHVKIWQEN